MNTSVIVSSILICFIPLIAVYLSFVLLIKGFSWWRGLVACLCGVVAVIPIAGIQFLMQKKGFNSVNSLSMVLLSAIVLNGFVEETIKMAIQFCIPAGKVELKEFFADGILTGLTLACFESLVYLISGYDQIGLRLITAVVIHVTCAGLSSLMVYSIKHDKRAYIIPYIFAVVLHGIYNYFAGFDGWVRYFSIAVILVAVIECATRYGSVKEHEAGGLKKKE